VEVSFFFLRGGGCIFFLFRFFLDDDNDDSLNHNHRYRCTTTTDTDTATYYHHLHFIAQPFLVAVTYIHSIRFRSPLANGPQSIIDTNSIERKCDFISSVLG